MANALKTSILQWKLRLNFPCNELSPPWIVSIFFNMKQLLKNFDPRIRMNRRTYWRYTALWLAISIVLSALLEWCMRGLYGLQVIIVAVLFGTVTIGTYTLISIRRIMDLQRSAYWVLTPILMLAFCFVPFSPMLFFLGVYCPILWAYLLFAPTVAAQ